VAGLITPLFKGPAADGVGPFTGVLTASTKSALSGLVTGKAPAAKICSRRVFLTVVSS